MPLEDWMEVLRKCFKSDQLRLDGKLPPRGKERERELIKRLFGEDNVDLGNSGKLHDAVIRYDVQDGKIEVKRDGKMELKIEFKEQLDVQWFDPSKYVGKYKYEDYSEKKSEGEKKSESDQETIIFVFACKKGNCLDLVYAVKESVLLKELFGSDKVLYDISKEVQTRKAENKHSKIRNLQLKVPLSIRKLYEKRKNAHSKDLLVLFAKNENAHNEEAIVLFAKNETVSGDTPCR
jgi:hypothetical protein